MYNVLEDMNNLQLTQILDQLYKEAYAISEPPVEYDFDELYNKYGDQFFEYFYLDRDTENKLVESFFLKYKRMKKFHKDIIKRSYYLGCSPTTNKELVDRRRCLSTNETPKNE